MSPKSAQRFWITTCIKQEFNAPHESLRRDAHRRHLGIELSFGSSYKAARSGHLPAAGASPSGKASVFGTDIPRFESWRPSQFNFLNKINGLQRFQFPDVRHSRAVF